MQLSLSVYLFQIAREKSCDYVLIIYIQEYERGYLNCVEAKRAHQVQKIIYLNPASDIVRSAKTTTKAKKFKVRLNISRIFLVQLFTFLR